MIRAKTSIAVACLEVFGTFVLYAQPQVKVVNIMPYSRSGDVYQDSEPTLAVHPGGDLIAAAAMTDRPTEGALAPIFISSDGGGNWAEIIVMPSTMGATYPFMDPSLSFSFSGTLYTSILRAMPDGPGTFELDILKKDGSDNSAEFKSFGKAARHGVDQPHIQSARAGNANKDLIFVGSNDDTVDSFGRTATVDQYLDNSGKFTRTRIEARRTATRDGAPIRIAVHPSQRTYAAFFARRQLSTPCPDYYDAEVVIVRDDSTGLGKRSFASLLNPGPVPANAPDTPPDIRGRVVKSGILLPITMAIGRDRVGFDMALAVDPGDAKKVYLAWADIQGHCDRPAYTLHLYESSDGGESWVEKQRATARVAAKNPSLAINNNGTLALLYQRFVNSRWQTVVERWRNGSLLGQELVLADTDGMAPRRRYQPYLGDYTQMIAIESKFYGAFSANNRPQKTNFPFGVVYMRRAECEPTVPGADPPQDCALKVLKDFDGKPVEESIDPFFFKIE